MLVIDYWYLSLLIDFLLLFITPYFESSSVLCGWLALCLAVYPHGKRLRYTLNRGLGLVGSGGGLHTVEKREISCPNRDCNSDFSIIQPITLTLLILVYHMLC
jgi:hypothetical protein